MPNRSSKSGHTPLRTCVICRNKQVKHLLLRIVPLEGELIIDVNKKLQTRGYYSCDNNSCLQSLDKWAKKNRKRRNFKNE